MQHGALTVTQQAKTGSHGEQLAVEYLTEHGFTIVATNWHCQYGEIDIVARDGDTTVFVEVRTRRSSTSEAAFASITPAKQARMVAAAQMYLQEHNQEDTAWRIDVIGIALFHGSKPVIDHIRDALGW